MARLEELTRDAHLHGVIPNEAVQVIDVEWHGSNAVSLTYRDQRGRPWSLDSDGALFRLAWSPEVIYQLLRRRRERLERRMSELDKERQISGRASGGERRHTSHYLGAPPNTKRPKECNVPLRSRSQL